MGGLRASRLAVALALVLTGVTVGVQSAGAGLTPEQLAGARGGVAILDSRTGKELWTVRPTEQVSYFSAAPGRDVVVAASGSSCADLGQVAAFDARSGRRRWAVPSAGSVLTSVHRTSTYFQAVVPADALGVVVVTSEDGTTGYSSNDGTVAWSRPAHEVALGVSDVSVFTADRQDPAVHGFRALDRRTGNVRWEHGGEQDPVQIVAADQRYVVVATGEISSQRYGQVTFIVLDARTGNELSRFGAGHPEDFTFSEVALSEHRLVYAQRKSIVARKLPQGTQDWIRKIDNGPGAVTMARSTDNATAFALRSGTVRRVVAVDTTTGRQRWTKTGVSLLDADSIVAVLSPVTTGAIETLRGTDTASGVPRWHYDVPSDLSSYEYPDFRVGNAGGRIALSTGCNPG